MNDEEIFRLLGWALIEWKVQYHRPNLVHPAWGDTFVIDNIHYDIAEGLYKTYAKRLGKPTYTTDMVEIDENRGSVKLVLDKMSNAPGVVAKGAGIRATLSLEKLKQILKVA